MAKDIFKQSLIIFFLFFFSFLFSYFGKAQTSISGIVNRYIDVTAIIDADELTVSDALAFSPGDTVLLIQMKGLAINNTNDLSFGSRQNVYSAGKYEIIIIASITGTNITFASDMTNSYDTNGHMQMVRVPGYDNARVTGNITCPEWDTISGTGGVVALIVGNKLSLEADIDVTGKGFGGAVPYTTSNVLCTTNTDFYFPASSDSAGYKGEGVVSYALDNTQPLDGDFAKGRGAYFNGGGGGNGKYSGGGGGANGGSGGLGGKQYEPCGILDGIGGIGGRAIPNEIGGFDTDKLIFMGGGGGSSTQLADGDGTTGGNGGGIIIILADTVIGNGNYIRANGQTVVDITNNTGGAGGGGAGGTILLDVKGYKGSTLNVQASGGNGGWSGAIAGYCTGPGGGGGGGIVWYSQVVLPAEVNLNVNGGAAGISNCTFWGQSQGNIGTTVANLKVPLTGFLFNSIFSIQSEALNDTICEEDILPELLGTEPRGGTTPYKYKWESSNDNSTWIIDLDYGAGGEDYNPLSVMIDTTYYRRTVKDNSAPVIEDISKTVTIIVQPKIEQNSLSFDTIICLNQMPNPIIPEFTSPIGGDGIYSYLWEQSTDGITFADAPNVNNTSIYQPPVLSVAQTYYYRRTVYSGKCSHISDTVTITVLPLISSNTISADQTICQGSVFDTLAGTDPANGDGTYTYKWIESIDGNTWGNAYGPGAGKNYSPDTTSSDFPGTLFFKRVVYSGLSDCCVDTSNNVTLIDWPKLENNSINTDQVICEGDDPVAISGLTPTGGNGVYTYQWQERSGVAAWSDIGLDAIDYDPSNLSDTTFYRRVVDSDVCTDTSNIDTIPVHPSILYNNILTLGGLTDTTICEGALPNSLTGEQPGGGIGIYSYIWKESTDGSSWSAADGTYTNIDYSPGNLIDTTFYKREVFSGVCADMSVVIDINVLPALGNNSVSSDQTICYNAVPDRIDGVLPTGGDGGYTYQWEESTDNVTWNPASGTDNEQNYQPEALSIPKFFRRVIFSGAVDCCSDTSNVVSITINSLPTGVLVSLVDTICKGSNVALTVNLTGALPWDFTYSDGTSSFDENNVSNSTYSFNVSPDNSSPYTLSSVTDDNGCIATSLTGTANITVYEIPVANAGEDDEICELVYTLDAVPSVGSGLWTYSTVPVLSATDNTQAQNQVTLSDYGTYSFTWTESNWNCIDSDDVEIVFWESPTPAEAGADQLLSSYAKETLLEGNVPLTGVGEWTKLLSESESIIENPFEPGTRVSNLLSGEYEFVWTITNGVCPEESDAVKITVNMLFIPSGFSPNGDEINDFFEIKGINDISNELIIINSGGNEVYRQKNYQNDWDGTYKTGEELPDGTYYYIFYIYDTDKPREESGFVVIKR
ncbi:MAG: gliding motility-associated C-terminal domain-containing protein [Bacteroidales bacterium]|nr:gliding motility-associated C-terminal domain-containing protein [Bacteroidales bacterium]